jgi:hypothetical protein
MGRIGEGAEKFLSVDISKVTTPQVWPVAGAPIPGTLWVRPTAGNTLTVAYSTDNGVNYQSLTSLTGATAYSETVVNSGFTHLKITCSGTQGGTWGVC